MIKAFVTVPKCRTVGMAVLALLDIHLKNIVMVAYGIINQQSQKHDMEKRKN